MRYQILVLDLDGTLTNSKKEITPPTKQALLEIQEAGKKVVLASGRPTMGVAPLAKQLNLADYGSYILSFNGGRITNCRTGEIVYNQLLPNDIIEPVYNIARKYPVDILAYGENSLYSGIEPNMYSETEAYINKVEIDRMVDFVGFVTAQDNNKLLLTGNPDVIEQVRQEMILEFRDTLNIYCSEPFFLEIMPKNIDKAYSLKNLLNTLSLTKDEMICCGDGHNDLTMIQLAGLGVAMANAQPLVLKNADYITKSNDEDGVLHVINEFMRD